MSLVTIGAISLVTKVTGTTMIIRWRNKLNEQNWPYASYVKVVGVMQDGQVRPHVVAQTHREYQQDRRRKPAYHC